MLVINGLLPIKFALEKRALAQSLDDNLLYSHEPATLLATRSMSVFSSSIKLLSTRPYYTKMIFELLSGMGVQEREWLSICRKNFRVVDVAVPDGVIEVTISDVTTIRYYARTIEDVAARYRAKLIPATKSARANIDGLEKVRVDSFERGKEGGSRLRNRSKQTCVICMDPLNAASTAYSCAEGEVTINRLPCLHLYHEDCIVKWLKSTICVLCVDTQCQLWKKPNRCSHRLNFGRAAAPTPLMII